MIRTGALKQLAYLQLGRLGYGMAGVQARDGPGLPFRIARQVANVKLGSWSGISVFDDSCRGGGRETMDAHQSKMVNPKAHTTSGQWPVDQTSLAAQLRGKGATPGSGRGGNGTMIPRGRLLPPDTTVRQTQNIYEATRLLG